MSVLAGVDPRSALRLCQRAVEFRAAEPVTDGRNLQGYAAVFDQPTIIESAFGQFEEVVSQGAFRKTLRERMPVMQFNHGNDKAIGEIPIASIRELREDEHGLFVDARLFDNDLVEPVRQAIAGRAIRGMSFKFRVLRDRWVDRDGEQIGDEELADLLEDPGERGPIRREIREVELFELGPVVFPAYTQTSVGVRSLPARSPFDPNLTAVRGVLAQFGLDERCVHRHLAVFGELERQALAREIAATFPELARLFAADDRTAVAPHNTATAEGTWDADANVARLPSPMPLAIARREYAWYNAERVQEGDIVKDACKLPHHEVGADGQPGAANLNGVRNALARLGQTDGISDDERAVVEEHLRNHLPSDDGGNNEASDSGPGPAASPEPASQAEPAPPRHPAYRTGDAAAPWHLPRPDIGSFH